MSQFYSRYVPPVKSSTEADIDQRPLKRKRSEKSRSLEENNKRPRTSPEPLKEVNVNGFKTSGKTENLRSTQADKDESIGEVLDKYRVSKVTRQDRQLLDIKFKKEQKLTRAQNENGSSSERRQKKKKARGKETGDNPNEFEDEAYKERHAGILSRFETSRSEIAQSEETLNDLSTKPSNGENISSEELHGLEPIPQPEQNQESYQKPLFSTLAAWQADALKVGSTETVNFDKLDISQTIEENLRKHGFEKAFPVQSAVLPLLLNGQTRYDGDLCISAATGSGKTLAYILPMIEGLTDLPITKLRGLIVVPTRELVVQVHQQMELFAAGTNLKIGTALGSKSMKNEEESLIGEDEVYDPEDFKQQQESPIDWSSFSLEQVIQKAHKANFYELNDFVTRYKSKVDILITTPGRLVDHLRTTTGFNLDDVKWLVVDEADRLLNESYQEWIDVVVPALQTQRSTKKRDDILRYMRIDPPRRVVKKILLSATMTNDVSKLNSLGLNKPKLVLAGNAAVVGENDNTAATEEPLILTEGAFVLPPTLSEYAIPAEDGSQKPLLLLKLLESHIGLEGLKTREEKVPTASSVDSSLSDSLSSTSSETESEPNSDPDIDLRSDSNSDADSGSDSVSLTTSSTSEHDSEQNSKLPIKQKIQEPRRVYKQRALIFTRSTASAARLARLFSLLIPNLSSQMSTLTRSTTASSDSRRAFSSFRNSKTSILIATDRASRGLDVPGLEHVINYDVPSSALTYVHRIGRTARAGKEGQAWTLVEHREGRWFWDEIGGKGGGKNHTGSELKIQRNKKIQRVNLTVEDAALKDKYQKALEQLGEEVKGV